MLTALDVLGYERPTQLRGERARLVGLVLPELQNPIFPAFADVVGGALAQQGFTPVLCTRTAGGVTEAAYIDLLFEQQVSGVVFAGGLYAQAQAPHGHYAKLAERSLPVVLVNAAVDWLDFPRVSCDDVDGRRAGDGARDRRSATRRIGLVLGPSDHVPSQRKLEGARLAAARHGLDAARRASSPTRIFSLEGGQAAGDVAAAPRGHGDDLCQRPAGARRRPGRPPARAARPGATSRWSATTTRLFMRYTDPPLTTVRQPIEAMGRAAVDRLVSQFEGRRDGPGELLFAPELVVRGSTVRRR